MAATVQANIAGIGVTHLTIKAFIIRGTLLPRIWKVLLQSKVEVIKAHPSIANWIGVGIRCSNRQSRDEWWDINLLVDNGVIWFAKMHVVVTSVGPMVLGW